VTFWEPSDLSFADHVHRFVARYGVECAIHGPEPETGSDSFFDKAVILLDDVVEVRRRSAAAVAPQFAGSLQIRNYLRVRRMSVDVDYPRSDLASARQSPSKEVFGGHRIAVRREHEVDRIALGIDGAVQISPVPRDSNIRLIHPPRAVWMPKFAPDALVQLPGVPEDPAGQ